MAYVYDFAGARPTPEHLQAGEAAGVCRYIKKYLPNDYDLDKDERDGYLAQGLGVLYNAEQHAGDLTEQGPGYFRDYGKYVSDRLQSWGTPTNQGINVALSADSFVSDAALPGVIRNYVAFAQAVLPFGTTAYAQIQVIALLVAEGISPPGAKFWLPSAISWSGYDTDQASWDAYMAYPHAGLVQLYGNPLVPGTDMNVPIDLPAMGFHWPAGSPYAKEDDMPTIEEIRTEIQNVVLNIVRSGEIEAAIKRVKIQPTGVNQEVEWAAWVADIRYVLHLQETAKAIDYAQLGAEVASHLNVTAGHLPTADEIAAATVKAIGAGLLT